MSLKSESGRKEHYNKKIHLNMIKIFGILLVGTFLTATIFSNISFGAGNDAVSINEIADAKTDQNKDTNAALKNQINKVIMKMDLNKKRMAAADRLKAAGQKATRQSSAISTATSGLVTELTLPVGMDPGGLPHYYGPYPNYANSPMPTFTTATTQTTFGNQLNDRAFASDHTVLVGELAPVFVVVPSAVLPAGTLLNFQTWNQATAGESEFPSYGNIFYAYVLHPTGILNQYTVVFNSSLLTVPTPDTPGTSQIATFPVTPFTVQAGDVIGFYGQGIPFDTGTGNDILSYMSPTPPANASTITLGVDGGFPFYSQVNNYSIAATVEVGTTVLTGGIRKFVDALPGLNAAGANNLGQYIPIAIPDTTTYPGADYYEIELGQYTEKMHSDLPPTTLRGYRQTNTADPNVSKFNYLGPLIIAKRDTPVRIKFTNSLPTGSGGDLFLPVDTTIMGSGPFMIDDPMNPGMMLQGNFTQNRATLHLHGGFVPWISDGTPHQWITPAGETTDYPKGVSLYNVPDMPDPGPGSMTFYYNNQQSARLQFYHDHAFGITRLNVYAGEAAGYLVTDQVEQDMIDGTNVTGINPDGVKVLPDVGIPLIIQDKTFVDASTIAQQDPTWNWGTGTRDTNGKITEVNTGDLWLPHVYMPNQNPSDPGGMNAFGRWFYSPWFFPAPIDVIKGPKPNPHCLPTPGVDCSASLSPVEHTLIPDVPNPSFAMEAFMDTPIVNGVAYPNITVEPKTYRFRILNAANDRFLNLQMYVADPAITTQDGRTFTEVKMVPAVSTIGYPVGWPIDGREGGVPDPATKGPSFIQIGTEGGFLPAPVVLPNQPVDWNMDQTNFDMGLVNKGTLLMGTAERADVIVDFSQFAGKTIILYNDAPAPFPAIDVRYDYYTGHPDLTGTGGAPSTLAGYGPNTRTIMQIKVNDTTPAAPYDLAALQAVFARTSGKRGVFEVSQDEIIVQQKAYETAYDKVYSNDKFVGINDKTKTFLTALGTPMTINFNFKAIHDEASAVYSVDDGRMSAMLGLTKPGLLGFIPIPYFAPPVEIIKDSVYGTPLGSTEDGTQIWKITHNGVDTHTIHFHLFNVQLINRVAWDNAIRKADPNEVGWKETLRMNPLQDTVVALRPVAPTQPFKVPNSVRPIDVTMPVGFPLTPPPGGWKDPYGNPTTVLNNVINFGWEYVYHCHILGHEEMDMMHEVSLTVAPDAPIDPSATLGENQVFVNWRDNSTDETNFTIQRNTGASAWATIAIVPSTTGPGTGSLKSYIDTTVVPHTIYNYRVLATNIVGDTNTANFPTMSVDSAPSGIVTPPGPVMAPTNLTATIFSGTRIDLSWIDRSNNETNFDVWRSINGGLFIKVGSVTRTAAQKTEIGGTVIYSNTGLTAGQTYTYYVIAINTTIGQSFPSNIATVVFTVPAAPSGLIGTAVSISGNNAQENVTLTWTDNSNNEDSFQIQRATTSTFAVVTSFTVGANLVLAPGLVTYSQNAPSLKTFYYRVRTTNLVGSSAWNVFGPLHPPPAPVVAPTNLTATIFSGTRIDLRWIDRSNNETSFDVWRSINDGLFIKVGSVTRTAAQKTAIGGTVIYSNTGLTAGNIYAYYVTAMNTTLGQSLLSNTATVVFTVPPVPSGLIGTTVRISGNNAQENVTLTWTDNANNENSFQIQRATTSTFAIVTSFTVGANLVPAPGQVTYTQNAPPTTYYYRVRATNLVGSSAWTVFGPLHAPPAPVVAPTNLTATIFSGTRIDLKWIDRSNNETSFNVWRSINGGLFIKAGSVTRTAAQKTATGGTVIYSNTGLTAGNTYVYYVTAMNTTMGQSLPSNIATVVFMVPAVPSGLTGTAVRIGTTNQADVSLTWTDNANNENSFQIQRATTSTFAVVTSFTVGANLALAPGQVTYNQNAPSPKTYYYRIRATNLVGSSAWNVFGPLNAP